MALSSKIGAREVFAKDAPKLITIELARTTERMEARIQALDEQGKIISESTAHAPSWRCDQLANRIVFALRDIVDPLNPSTPASSPSAPSPPLPPSSPPTTGTSTKDNPPENSKDAVAPQPPVVSSNEPTSSRSQSKQQFALSMALGASWWSAPNTAWSTVFGVALRWPRFSIGLEGRYDYASKHPPEERVAANQMAMALLACGQHAFVPTRFYGRGCLFGDLARWSVDSTQIRLTESARIMLQFGARVGAGFSLTRTWAVELQGNGTVAVQQPQFVYNKQERWQFPRFHGALRANVIGLFDMF